ncbi:hypothetical protein CHLRE_01g041850v5 [Chlamydomonas reinhardtii]|uniref:Uncharacterized protein n=1 Tax=Chlamydomonas reinhardtii TaxID=3055 RepID=A0A2K3E7H0_CHLRE|nr:uncharacterized protein CHLRE_01g041850v5 [Chlamydomonas reinhardtii]PNW88729.1 hypothetical protein CHLRE_01g041850v5 [Chlamydomonas reinhardtii]
MARIKRATVFLLQSFIITLAKTAWGARLLQQSTADDRASALQNCYNEHYNGTASVFEDFLRGFNTSLYLHQALISAKPAPLPVTIFVGATLERLGALEAQCRAWPRGPLSAALYLPLLQRQDGRRLTPDNTQALRGAADTVRELFERMEAAGASACSLTALLLYEAVADPALAALVPINALRDAALLPAATPLVAMVDVDLAPSASLAGQVAAPGQERLAQLQRAAESGRVAWILPAWETHKRLGLEEGGHVADTAIAGDKSGLRRLVDQSALHYFARLAYRRGHGPTNFTRWLDALEPYTVPYADNYEPWFIISRTLCPPYDVRFRGYGWNKVQQVALVALTNFTFVVHPDAWLVHRPHPKSRSQQLYDTSGLGAGAQAAAAAAGRGGAGGGGAGGGRGGAGAGGGGGAVEETREWKGSRAPLSRLFHRRVAALRHVTIRDMRRRTYAAAVGPQVLACRAALPWWAGVDPEPGGWGTGLWGPNGTEAGAVGAGVGAEVGAVGAGSRGGGGGRGLLGGQGGG